MSDTSSIVSKLWNYCNVLRDDGLSYQDYLEQITTLLFLKMAEERAELTGEEQPIPNKYRWAALVAPKMTGERLELHYREALRELGKSSGMLGLIFRKAQNKIQDPAKLRQLIVELIGKETWTSLTTDVKGDAYEGLLEKNAQDVKGGAGQYFTPRPLIDAIVDCVDPQPMETICDPACGTGGLGDDADADADALGDLTVRAAQGPFLAEDFSILVHAQSRVRHLDSCARRRLRTAPASPRPATERGYHARSAKASPFCRRCDLGDRACGLGDHDGRSWRSRRPIRVFTTAIPVITRPIPVFTIGRSSCSRWSDRGVHDRPRYAASLPALQRRGRRGQRCPRKSSLPRARRSRRRAVATAARGS